MYVWAINSIKKKCRSWGGGGPKRKNGGVRNIESTPLSKETHNKKPSGKYNNVKSEKNETDATAHEETEDTGDRKRGT